MALGRRRQFQDVFSEVMVARVAVDPAAFVDNESQEINVTVPGARLGDVVLVGPGVDVTEAVISAHVTANDTVSIVLGMLGGDTNNLAASTWNVVVMRVRNPAG